MQCVVMELIRKLQCFVMVCICGDMNYYELFAEEKRLLTSIFYIWYAYTKHKYSLTHREVRIRFVFGISRFRFYSIAIHIYERA